MNQRTLGTTINTNAECGREQKHSAINKAISDLDEILYELDRLISAIQGGDDPLKQAPVPKVAYNPSLSEILNSASTEIDSKRIDALQMIENLREILF